MPGSLSTLKALCAAFALLFVVAHPAAAQLSFKPTAEAVQEDKLLNALKEGDKITGRISIPDAMSSSLIQPAGRDWRDFQRSKLPIIGGVAIIGMVVLLAIFLMVRGRIRVEHGFSGRKILRFASFRALHPLADGKLLHRAGAVGPQHQLRPHADSAAVRRRSLLDHVGLRQIRPRLSGVSVHARPRDHVPDLDQGQHSRASSICNGSSRAAASWPTASIRRPSASTPARRAFSGS